MLSVLAMLEIRHSTILLCAGEMLRGLRFGFFIVENRGNNNYNQHGEYCIVKHGEH